jgi:hypothetical protein
MLVAGKWRGSIIVNSQWTSCTLRPADALRRGERLAQHPKSPPLMLVILPILARELNATLAIFDGFVHSVCTMKVDHSVAWPVLMVLFVKI